MAYFGRCLLIWWSYTPWDSFEHKFQKVKGVRTFLVAQSGETQQKTSCHLNMFTCSWQKAASLSTVTNSSLIANRFFLSSVPKQVNKKLAQLHKNSGLKLSKPPKKTSNTFWSHLVFPQPSDFITALHLEKSHSKGFPHQKIRNHKNGTGFPTQNRFRFPGSPPWAVHSKDAPPAPGLVSPKLNSQTLTKVGPKSPVISRVFIDNSNL